MILLDRVTKTYGKDNAPALNRLSLFVEPREFVIIIGSSGAGKSTLLKLLTREEKPDSGKIVVGGIDYDTLRDKHIPLLRRKIGVVFQDFKLLPKLTVFENDKINENTSLMLVGSYTAGVLKPQLTEKRALIAIKDGVKQQLSTYKLLKKSKNINIEISLTTSNNITFIITFIESKIIL